MWLIKVGTGDGATYLGSLTQASGRTLSVSTTF